MAVKTSVDGKQDIRNTVTASSPVFYTTLLTGNAVFHEQHTAVFPKQCTIFITLNEHQP